MKIIVLFFVLLIACSFAAYCQDLGPEDQNFHFIEAGFGAGLSEVRHDDAALSVAMSNSIGKYIVNFLEYNLYFDKSRMRGHEISFKMGPYYQINRYSYMAISTGVSLLMNSTDDNYTNREGITYYEDDYHLNIPLQVKINVGIYKGLCFGLKGTYNKMLDKNTSDRGSVQGYLAYGW